jgi:hypothetical protein
MSIRDEVNRCIGTGELLVLRPALPSTPANRTIVVSAELHAQLIGPWGSAKDTIRWNRVRADLDWFIGGHLIVVSDDGYMKSLEPESEGIWEIACRNPKPSIRVFGGFTETNVFSALTWRYRKPLGAKGSPEWAEAIRECKAEWKKHFLVYPPHTGLDIKEYIQDDAIRI